MPCPHQLQLPSKRRVFSYLGGCSAPNLPIHKTYRWLTNHLYMAMVDKPENKMKQTFPHTHTHTQTPSAQCITLCGSKCRTTFSNEGLCCFWNTFFFGGRYSHVVYQKTHGERCCGVLDTVRHTFYRATYPPNHFIRQAATRVLHLSGYVIQNQCDPFPEKALEVLRLAGWSQRLLKWFRLPLVSFSDNTPAVEADHNSQWDDGQWDDSQGDQEIPVEECQGMVEYDNPRDLDLRTHEILDYNNPKDLDLRRYKIVNISCTDVSRAQSLSGPYSPERWAPY